MSNTSERVIPNEANADLTTHTIRIGKPGEDNKQDINSAYQVQAIHIQKVVNKIPTARIVILDGSAAAEDFEISNTDDFVPGKALDILVGYHSQEATIFKGIIIKHSIRIREDRAKVLEIECKDQLFLTSLNRRSAYYEEMLDSEVLEEILDTYSFEYDIQLPPSAALHEKLVQYHATDWDFMVSRAEANQSLLLVDDGKVDIKPPDLEQDSELSLIFGSNVLEFEGEMDARKQFNQVKCFSWNPREQVVKEIENEVDPNLAQGNLDSATLAEVGQVEAYRMQHQGFIDESELQAWSDAFMLKSRLSRIRGRVKYQGNPQVKPGKLVELQGMGNRFNGKAFVSAVRHEIVKGDWMTHIQIGLSTDWFSQKPQISDIPAAGLLPAVQGLQIGIVTQLEDDPEGEDRIKVRVPLIDPQAEGIWARVACLDAGQNRGSYFRPELNDEVILGFLNDDPRHAVVLGMLNSSAKPAPIVASNDNHEKGFVSRSGIKLLFNDEKRSLLIETPSGKKINVDEDAGAITLQDENNNKMDFSSAKISLESGSDLEIKATGNIKIEGVNIELKASGQMSAEGNGGMQLNSSSNTVITGTPVNIN